MSNIPNQTNPDRLREIKDLKRQIEHIDQEVASLAYRRKFLKHRLNDLEYEVRKGDSNEF